MLNYVSAPAVVNGQIQLGDPHINNLVLVTTGANNVTVLIPPAANAQNGAMIGVKKVDAGTGIVYPTDPTVGTLTGNSGIGQLNYQNAAVVLMSDGTNWHLISTV